MATPPRVNGIDYLYWVTALFNRCDNLYGRISVQTKKKRLFLLLFEVVPITNKTFSEIYPKKRVTVFTPAPG